MLAFAAVTGASKVAGGLGSFFGSYDKETDQHRQETNADFERLARGGNMNAYRALLGRSGRAGTIIINEPFGNHPAGSYDGWASEPAKNDAYNRYKALQPIMEPELNFVGHESPDELAASRADAQQRASMAGGWGLGLVLVALVLGALVMGRKAPAGA